MYDEVKQVVSDVENAVHIYGSEGNRGVTMGRIEDVPQVIEVEFHGPVSEDLRIRMLERLNGTGWEFVDEDNVFEGDNERGGLISVSRDVDPEELPALQEDFERSEEL